MRSDWSLFTTGTGTGTGTSSLGSLLALTGALSGTKDPCQKIDPDQLDAYKRAFDEFDLDGDGKISTQELQLAFRRV